MAETKALIKFEDNVDHANENSSKLFNGAQNLLRHKEHENSILEQQNQSNQKGPCICNCNCPKCSKNNNSQDSIQSYHSVKINQHTSSFDMYKGYLYMLISCLFRTALAISEKVILENLHLTAYQLNALTVYYMFGISGIIFLFSLAGGFDMKLPKSKGMVGLIFVRSLCALLVETMLVKALKFLPASNVYSVFFLYPAVVIALAVTILGESVSCMDLIVFPVSCVGVIFVVRPKFIFTDEEENVMSSEAAVLYLLVLVACLEKGTGDFLVRKINGGVHFLVFPMALSLFGILFFPILPIIENTPLPEMSLNLNACVGLNAVFFFGYHTFLAYSLQFESAGRVVMVNYLQLVFLFFADLFVFKKPYHVS